MWGLEWWFVRDKWSTPLIQEPEDLTFGSIGILQHQRAMQLIQVQLSMVRQTKPQHHFQKLPFCSVALIETSELPQVS
jgi:hypothetical protein